MESPTLDQLQQQQKELIDKEDYVAAEDVMRQINKFLRKSASKQVQELQARQTSDTKNLEQSFSDEKRSLAQCKEEEKSQLNELHEKQIKDLHANQKERYATEKGKLEATVNIIFKPSSHLLNMIECKEKAVRLKKFLEAEALKLNIAELRRQEEHAYAADRRDKINTALKQLEDLFKREKERMETKQQETMEEYAIRLKTDMGKMTRKHANLRNDMLNSHRIELNIAHGKQTSGVGQPHPYSPEKSKMSTGRSRKPN